MESNKQRIERAGNLMRAVLNEYDEESPEDSLTDFLTDLCHAARGTKMVTLAAIRAIRRYQAEIGLS
jgi:hypothetical protein